VAGIVNFLQLIKMSLTINSSENSGLPIWMTNIIHPTMSINDLNRNGLFEPQILNKINHLPHYPGPIQNIGGLYIGSHCRIPGVNPLIQPILRPKTCIPHCLTRQCFEYGNTHFPPQCECDEKSDCRSYPCPLGGKVRVEALPQPYPCPLGGKVRVEALPQPYTCCGQGRKCSPNCGRCNHNSNVIYH